MTTGCRYEDDPYEEHIMMHRPKGLISSWRDWRRRLARAGGAVAAVALVASGTAWGLAGGPAAGAGVRPLLTADTNAGCNAPQPAGFSRCFAIVRTPADHRITADAAGPPSGALGPADIQSAYKLPATGGGQTVAIVDAFGDSTAESDLAAFRAQYGLPVCTTANGCFTKVDQSGQQGDYPPDNADWAVETSLDLDAVSAACPACNILLVEATDSSDANLGAAVDEAVTLGAKYVSNSYGSADGSGHGVEFPGETASDSFYNHPGVAVTASAGDGGWGVTYPAASPYVTSVGGTSLTKDTSVSRGWDEKVWGNGTQGASGDGTGSGCSQYEPKPDFQQAVTTGCDNRATADIAADADPASGLAVYDTLGQGGWLQVGGTSLSSPLTAAMFALAGTPQPGTYPVSYPYHDPSQAKNLFDVTTGSNGTCGNLLCQAGPGWDGPTGLGTPDGVAALTSGPQGVISGRVTDASTGKPISGATVAAAPGGYATPANATGHFKLNIAAGRYTLTVTDYGYKTDTQTGVKVTAGQTSAENYKLTPGAFSTLSGTVTDPGHGWPLYAQITIAGYPGGPVFTNPVTGKYAVKLADSTSYTLQVQPVYPGYQASDTQVKLGAANRTQNIKPAADLAACTAPGYGWNGLTETFAGWTGATPRDGWHVSGTPGGWRFDNPGNRPPAGSTGWATDHPAVNGVGAASTALGGDDQFAVADSAAAGRPLNTTLTSPPVSLSGQRAPVLSFDSSYYAVPGTQFADVEVSTDGGHTWTQVWHREALNAIGHFTIPVPAAAGQPDVRVRFSYAGRNGWYWAIDDIFLGTHTCVPQPGGLLAGQVTDHATGQPVNGAQITGAASPQPQSWPTGISQATSDPAHAGGIYWLFSPAGSQQFTATASGYTTAAATVSVTAGQVTRHNWALTPAGG
jgi:hypothetical protein